MGVVPTHFQRDEMWCFDVERVNLDAFVQRGNDGDGGDFVEQGV